MYARSLTRITGILLKSLIAGFVLELLWMIAAAPQAYSVLRALHLSAFALALHPLWMAWGQAHVSSQVRIARLIGWTDLLPLVRKSLAVTSTVGFLVALYLGVAIWDLKDRADWLGDLARWIEKEIIHFTIGCVDFPATRIFRLEVMGFVIGFAALLIVRIRAPVCFARMGELTNWRDLLARTIRTDGKAIPIRDLYRTLCGVVRDWSQLPEYSTYAWKTAQDRLVSLKAKMEDQQPGSLDQAALVVDALPDDNTRIREITEALFNFATPVQRLVISIMFVLSTFLVLLPIVVRTALFLLQ